MASPIRWFRKHSQFFIVVFGVFLMAIFGLGSVFTSLNPSSFGRNARENKVIAEWKDGELKQDDLFFLRQRHFAAQRLINQIRQFAVEQNNGEPFPIAAEAIMPIVRPGENPTTEEMDARMMDRYLYAQRAKNDGFVVDETMVLEYLAQFAGDVPLNKNLLKQLNRQVNPQTPLTPVVRHIQLELLSQQLENMTQGGLPFNAYSPVGIGAINPTEAIELYSRTNKRIECQVLPVSVGEYVSKVSEEPSESELRELYEKGKYEYPYLNYEQPGFKQFKKAKLQYFVGELETFLVNEIAKLTDEEVQKEYMRLVEEDDNLVMEIIPKTPAEEGESAENSEDGETGDEESSNETSSEGPSDEMDDEDATQSDTDESNVESPDAGDGDDGDEEKSESLLDQEEEQQDAEQSSDESDTEGGEEASDSASESESLAEGEEPAQGPDSAETEDATDATDDQDEEASQDPTMEDEPEQERKPKPLVDVAEEIKRRMKTEAARIARDQAMDAAEKELRKYQMELSKWEFDGEEKKIPKPTPPDFKAVADKLGVQYRETGFVDPVNIGDDPIGQIVTFEIVNRQPIQVNIGEQIFRDFEATPVYQPAIVNDFSNSSKVAYWMADKVEQKVPSFEEARESIVDYWKRVKAIELAKQEAQKIAEEANTKGKMLKDLYPEKALDTGAFPWFTTFGQFSYGRPAGVEEPAEEFMETAFGLDNKTAGVALNAPRDTAYVVQPTTEVEMSLNQLGTDYLERNFFLTRRIPQEVVSAKARYRQGLNLDWLREFRDDLKVKVVGQ